MKRLLFAFSFGTFPRAFPGTPGSYRGQALLQGIQLRT
jgi:hypothetical protein